MLLNDIPATCSHAYIVGERPVKVESKGIYTGILCIMVLHAIYIHIHLNLALHVVILSSQSTVFLYYINSKTSTSNTVYRTNFI